MHHDQSRKKTKNGKNTKIGGKFINLADIGEYAMCIIGLGQRFPAFETRRLLGKFWLGSRTATENYSTSTLWLIHSFWPFL